MENSKVHDSCNSNPKFKISNPFGGTSCGPYRCCDYPAKLPIFGDNRDHFVAIIQTICHNLLEPGSGFIQLFKHNSKFVNEIRSAFCRPGLGVVWRRCQAGT